MRPITEGAKRRGAEEDSSNDFGDDPRLTNLG